MGVLDLRKWAVFLATAISLTKKARSGCRVFHFGYPTPCLQFYSPPIKENGYKIGRTETNQDDQ